MIKVGLERILVEGSVKIDEAPTEVTDQIPIADSLHIYVKDKAGVSTPYWRDDAGVEHEFSGGSGSAAPDDADYLVKTANASLSAERVVTDTATITWDWSTSGQAKANVVASVGGSAWSVLTNGDAGSPALMWDSNGDVIMTELCNGARC